MDCPGHFGHIVLALPIFHTGYITHTFNLLQMVCKTCSRVLLEDEKDELGFIVKNPDRKNSREYFRSRLDNPNISYQKKTSLKKQIMAVVKKVPKICSYCHDFNGPVKKVGFHKFLHEKFKFKETSRSKEHPSIKDFRRDMEVAAESNKEIRETVKSPVGCSIDPVRAAAIFANIPKEDYPLLCMAVEGSDPSSLILNTIPVSPSVIRPSIKSDIRAGTNEDDLTTALMTILKINNLIEKSIQDGFPISGQDGKLGFVWEMEQLNHALMINSQLNINSVPRDIRPKQPPRQSLVQRLKGKEGRFRQNLQGKRVNFTARSVISPDPNLRIDQVGIPIDVAKVLTFPEEVNRYNIQQMKQLVRNGAEYPGANQIQFRSTGDKARVKTVHLSKNMFVVVKLNLSTTC